MINSAAPGWYSDPGTETGSVRYWDGASWTEYTQPQPRALIKPPTPRVSWAGAIVTGFGVATYVVAAMYPFVVGGIANDMDAYMRYTIITGLPVAVVLLIGFLFALLGYRKTGSESTGATVIVVLTGLIFAPALIWAMSIPFFI